MRLFGCIAVRLYVLFCGGQRVMHASPSAPQSRKHVLFTCAAFCAQLTPLKNAPQPCCCCLPVSVWSIAGGIYLTGQSEALLEGVVVFSGNTADATGGKRASWDEQSSPCSTYCYCCLTPSAGDSNHSCYYSNFSGTKKAICHPVAHVCLQQILFSPSQQLFKLGSAFTGGLLAERDARVKVTGNASFVDNIAGSNGGENLGTEQEQGGKSNVAVTTTTCTTTACRSTNC